MEQPENFQINSNSEQMVKVSAKELAAKVRDKQEVYHFLSHACNIYLPSYDTVTVWHLRDLFSKKRTRIMGTEVKHLHVPQYEGLKIESMLAFASLYPNVMRVFPESRKETMKMPRQYLANCIYSIVGEPFKDWVNEKVNERHKKVLDDREIGIEMD